MDMALPLSAGGGAASDDDTLDGLQQTQDVVVGEAQDGGDPAESEVTPVYVPRKEMRLLFRPAYPPTDESDSNEEEQMLDDAEAAELAEAIGIDAGGGADAANVSDSEDEALLPPVNFNFRDLLIRGEIPGGDADEHVDFAQDMDKEINLTKLLCMIDGDTITAKALYHLTRFRGRPESTMILRGVLFLLYCDKSQVQIEPVLLAQYTRQNNGWSADTTPIMIPPLAVEVANMKQQIPSEDMLELACQQLVEAGRVIRLKDFAHPDHDLVADLEMYFHHLDYIRTVIRRITLPPTVVLNSHLSAPNMQKLRGELIRQTGISMNDKLGKLLRRIFYENYVPPIEVEVNMELVGPEKFMQAQRVYAIIHKANMNKMNKILSNSLYTLITERNDVVSHAGLLVVFVDWIASASDNKFAPTIHTMYTARDAPTWSFVFIYRLFFYIAPDQKLVGPFPSDDVDSCIAHWISNLYMHGDRLQKRIAKRIFRGDVVPQTAVNFLKSSMSHYFAVKRPYQQNAFLSRVQPPDSGAALAPNQTAPVEGAAAPVINANT
jgi:hypothetical protein